MVLRVKIDALVFQRLPHSHTNRKHVNQISVITKLNLIHLTEHLWNVSGLRTVISMFTDCLNHLPLPVKLWLRVSFLDVWDCPYSCVLQ